MNGSWLLGAVRVILFISLTLAMMPLQRLAVALNLRLSATLPRWYHRQSCRIFGFRIAVRGRPSHNHPTLYASNHSSYFDILVLGSLFTCSFIAKAEMIRWPLIGQLAKLQRSVFIDRKPANVAEHSSEIATRLALGHSLVLFAEGTTSDGNRLLPFKSSLFSVATTPLPDQQLTVQPVSIVATQQDGMPLGRTLRPLYAWYGDMPLVPHIWDAMKAGHLTIEVEFHEAFSAEGMTRKEICARCEAAVQQGVVRAITGREPPRLAAGNAALGSEINVAA